MHEIYGYTIPVIAFEFFIRKAINIENIHLLFSVKKGHGYQVVQVVLVPVRNIQIYEFGNWF